MSINHNSEEGGYEVWYVYKKGKGKGEEESEIRFLRSADLDDTINIARNVTRAIRVEIWDAFYKLKSQAPMCYAFDYHGNPIVLKEEASNLASLIADFIVALNKVDSGVCLNYTSTFLKAKFGIVNSKNNQLLVDLLKTPASNQQTKVSQWFKNEINSSGATRVSLISKFFGRRK